MGGQKRGPEKGVPRGAESGALESQNWAQQVFAEKGSKGQETTQAIERQWLMRYA